MVSILPPLLLFILLMASPLHGQTIEEKRQQLLEPQLVEEMAQGRDERLYALQRQLAAIYAQAQQLRSRQASQEEYGALYQHAREIIDERQRLESALEEQEVDKALWHLPETTVKNLVLDFGDKECLYIIPPELGERKVSLSSQLSLPSYRWSELLELILSHSGVGVRRVNDLCKELFVLEKYQSFELMISQVEQLELLPAQQRVCFLLEGDAVDGSTLVHDMTPFVDVQAGELRTLGGQLAFIGPVARIKQLVQIYQFLLKAHREAAYRLLILHKLSPEDAQKMLTVLLSLKETAKGCEGAGLSLLTVSYDNRKALFIAGTQAMVQRASTLVLDLERQVELHRGKQLFWYTPKHVHPQELAQMVAQVYQLLVATTTSSGVEKGEGMKDKRATGDRMLSYTPSLVVAPTPLSPGDVERNQPVTQQGQVVVDLSSGSLVMVVYAELVPSLKELINKLDTPKKLVRVDVLLFEKKTTDQTQFGLDQLKVSAASSGKNQSGWSLSRSNSLENTVGTAISQFFLSRERRGSIPSFDLAYNFLLSQENFHLHANPSILTINGMSSVINLVDEISINTGAIALPEAGEGTFLKDSYTRTQYGINIKVKPIVHGEGAEMGQRRVTLETDIVFDTPSSLTSDRPSVARRQIQNTVKVMEGETVVIGGLRQKQIGDAHTGLPFLSELPGIGRFFSYSHTNDLMREMFIFITPHVIDEEGEQQYKMRRILLTRRPGEGVEWGIAEEESRYRVQSRLFDQSLTMMLGRPSYERGGEGGR